MILDARLVPPERVRVVPHGGPDGAVPPGNEPPPLRCRAATWTSRRTRSTRTGSVLATFGPISPGKGIETAIAAMPAIIARHPEALYVVAGQTHPEVAKLHGEEYRLSLSGSPGPRPGESRGLRRPLPEPSRTWPPCSAATTIYLTPYRSREQIVSGALTFAIVAGCPTVSTPYFYAEDLLASGAGVLVPFDDPDALAAAVNDLLDDPERLEQMRRADGGGTSWRGPRSAARPPRCCARRSRSAPEPGGRTLSPATRRGRAART